MSYQVLARKWRPKSFDELVGQKQTAKALINALESQRLHHAYLFSGTRGVGKTTIARILSKSLNCEQGITSKPCGTCSSCIEIDQGNFVDLMEIDAASKTKVEDTRELLDNVQYRPTRGRYKVYLIDEVHMLSGHSFNALLKTLEEPPPHVVFLLATTDPQKLPVTVLSRCLQFNLKRMEEPEIIDHLAMILTAEEIEFEQQALAPIAKGADGSMRDGLSLLDQAIAFCGDKLVLPSVLEMLGSIDQSYCLQLLAAIQQNDAAELMQIIQQMSQYSPDYMEVMSDWLSLLHRIAVAQAIGKSDQVEIASFAESITPADLQLYYQLSLQAKKDLPYAPHPRQGFEMALLRVLAFRPSRSPRPQAKKDLSSDTRPKGNHESVEQVKKKLTSSNEPSDLRPVLEAAQEPGSKMRLVATNEILAKTKPIKPIQKIEAQVQESKPNEIQSNDRLNQPAQAEVEQMVYAEQSANVEQKVEVIIDDKAFAVDVEQMAVNKILYPDAVAVLLEQINEDNWHFVVDQMNINGNGHQVLLNSLATYSIGVLRIKYLTKVSHFLTENLTKSLHINIKEYFTKQTKTGFKVQLLAVETLAETPKQKQVKWHQAAMKSAFEFLSRDACVTKLQQQLGAVIDKQTIQLG